MWRKNYFYWIQFNLNDLTDWIKGRVQRFRTIVLSYLLIETQATVQVWKWIWRHAWYYRGKSVGPMAEKGLGTSAWGEPCGNHWRKGVRYQWRDYLILYLNTVTTRTSLKALNLPYKFLWVYGYSPGSYGLYGLYRVNLNGHLNGIFTCPLKLLKSL